MGGWGLEDFLPRRCVESQASRAAGDDGYFAIEREDVLEVIELDVSCGRHGCWLCGVMQRVERDRERERLRQREEIRGISNTTLRVYMKEEESLLVVDAFLEGV